MYSIQFNNADCQTRRDLSSEFSSSFSEVICEIGETCSSVSELRLSVTNYNFLLYCINLVCNNVQVLLMGRKKRSLSAGCKSVIIFYILK